MSDYLESMTCLHEIPIYFTYNPTSKWFEACMFSLETKCVVYDMREDDDYQDDYKLETFQYKPNLADLQEIEGCGLLDFHIEHEGSISEVDLDYRSDGKWYLNGKEVESYGEDSRCINFEDRDAEKKAAQYGSFLAEVATRIKRGQAKIDLGTDAENDLVDKMLESALRSTKEQL